MDETLWACFSRSMRRSRAKPALSVGEDTWTYSELLGAVATASTALADRGVGTGARVLLFTDNEAAFPIYDLAIMSLGAVKVPLSTMLTQGEVAEIAARTTARVAVVSDRLRTIEAVLPRDCSVVVPELLAPGADPPAGPAPSGSAAPGDPAVVYFTGGTTGRPKGVVHSQRGVVLNLFAHIMEGDIRTDERLLLTTPLAHAAGLFTLAGLLRGAHVRIEPGFDAEAVMATVDADASTWTFAVPTMIYRLLDAAASARWRPTSLRTLQYGAAPISSERLREAVSTLGPVLQQLYAQTECPNFATLLTKDDHVRALDEPAILASCGKATLMCEVAVLDGDGLELPPGEVGEVAFDAPYAMTGYWQDDVGYRERFAGRWLRSGDIGRLDDEGFLTLLDRRNDMVVSGGMNIYSIEVEQALQTFPGVGQAAVIGIPHPDWGEAVHALVVPDGDLDLAALTEHCRTQLAAYKRPKSIDTVDDLPVTRYGKVDKKALRATFWSDQARSIG